jgi:hypothetical protein
VTARQPETNGTAKHLASVLRPLPVQEPAPPPVKGPSWKRRPDQAGTLLDFQIFRVPAAGEKGLVILSHDIVGADTHFYRNRTRVCMGIDCVACRDSSPCRWRGYTFALRWQQQTVVLLEVTGAAMPNLHEWFCAHRTMRELAVDFVRMKGVANGRLIANNLRKYSHSMPLPAPKRVKDALTKLWRLNDQEALELERNENLGLAPETPEQEPKSE